MFKYLTQLIKVTLEIFALLSNFFFYNGGMSNFHIIGYASRIEVMYSFFVQKKNIVNHKH